jgi:hypothetical protein
MRFAAYRHRSRRAFFGCALALLTLVLGSTLVSAAAAAPPSTEVVTKSGTLRTADQDPFGGGGGASGPADQRFSLFDLNWNGSARGGHVENVDWHVGFDPTPDLCPGIPVDCDPYHGDDDGITVPVGDFGAEASANTQGEIGMSVGVDDFKGGSVGVDYPVDAHFAQPAQDTFAPGATVAIDTSVSVDPAASIHTTFPSASSVSLDGTFGFHADASGTMCVFSCFGGSIFSLSIPDNGGYTGPATGNIFRLDVPGTTCFNAVVNFAAGFSTYPNTRCNNNGYVATPNVTTTSRVNADGSVSASGDDTYAVVPVSAVTWATRLLTGGTKVPVNLGPLNIPGTSVKVGWTTANLTLTALESMKQDATFHANLDLTLDWGRPLSYEVIEDGAHVGGGIANSATFPVGDRLLLTTPADLGGALTVVPSLAVHSNTFTNHIENATDANGDFKALAFTLVTPSADFDPGFGIGTVTVWPGTSVNVGPAVHESLGSSTLVRNDVKSSSFSLAGFNQPTLAPLALDPDVPARPTAVTVTPVLREPFTGTVAKFFDPDTSDAAHAYDASIDWGDGTTSTGTLVADGVGLFHVVGTHTYAAEGPYPVTVRVDSTETEGVTATAHSRAVVFSYTAGGGFAVGDRSSALGASVTFWGAQWGKANSLSGGLAPPQFKGFVADTTRPRCGARWSGRYVGNSAGAPATVPGYTAAVVTSSVGASGSTISGDTVGMVVVHTSAGYGPSPGSAGTGTVVATIC